MQSAQPATSPPPLHTSDRPGPARRPRDWLPFWLILPTALVLLVIQVYPALYTLILSVQTRRPAGWEFVGVRNFTRLLSNGAFYESVGHTVIFLVGYTVITLVAGFAIALLLNVKGSRARFYMTLFFIPWVLADIIVGVVFRLLVLPDYGLLAGILQNPALFPPNGLSVLTADAARPWIAGFPFPPSPAMVYLILAAAWRALPFTTLLLLAALQTISSEILESARIDGANNWETVRKITVPLILPTMVVALFSLILSGMNGVGMVFSLTGGGPGNSTEVISYLLYSIGWNRLDFGSAAALSLMIGLVNLALIMGTLRITRLQHEAH
jgi:ABC-type sugar transport system permease subunit